MKITYDKEADAMYIYLKTGAKIYKTREMKENFIIDLDKRYGVIGVEILSASKYVSKKIINSSVQLGQGKLKTICS